MLGAVEQSELSYTDGGFAYYHNQSQSLWKYLPQMNTWVTPSVQLLSRVRLSATPWTAAFQASLSITNSQSLLKLCPLNWWCHPAISSSVVPFSSHPHLGDILDKENSFPSCYQRHFLYQLVFLLYSWHTKSVHATAWKRAWCTVKHSPSMSCFYSLFSLSS